MTRNSALRALQARVVIASLIHTRSGTTRGSKGNTRVYHDVRPDINPNAS